MSDSPTTSAARIDEILQPAADAICDEWCTTPHPDESVVDQHMGDEKADLLQLLKDERVAADYLARKDELLKLGHDEGNVNKYSDRLAELRNQQQ